MFSPSLYGGEFRGIDGGLLKSHSRVPQLLASPTASSAKSRQARPLTSHLSVLNGNSYGRIWEHAQRLCGLLIAAERAKCGAILRVTDHPPCITSICPVVGPI
jgi:hypothetical protein